MLTAIQGAAAGAAPPSRLDRRGHHRHRRRRHRRCDHHCRQHHRHGVASASALPTATTTRPFLGRSPLQQRVNTISADEADDFHLRSRSRAAPSPVYAGNGAPANVQMRWAKVNSTANGGAERWNLFILTNSEATGTGDGLDPRRRRLHLRRQRRAQPASRIHRADRGSTVNGIDRRRHPPAARRRRARPSSPIRTGSAEVTTLRPRTATPPASSSRSR